MRSKPTLFNVIHLASGPGILLAGIAGVGLGVSSILGFKDGYREARPIDDTTMHRRENVAAGYAATAGLWGGNKFGNFCVRNLTIIETNKQAAAVIAATTILGAASAYGATKALSPAYEHGFRHGIKLAQDKTEDKGR